MTEAERTYRPAEGLARTAQILLGVTLLIEIIAVPLTLLDAAVAIGAFDFYYELDPDYLLPSVGIMGFAALALVSRIPTVIVFWMWMYRVSSNLHAMGLELLEFQPSSMIWWWFVPCANLFMPFKAMRELELRSTPDGLEADLTDAHSPLLPAWWGCWVISGIMGRAAMRIGADGPIEVSVFVDLATTAVVAVCGVLAVLVVRRVQTLHTQKHASMVQAGEYAGPPLTF